MYQLDEDDEELQIIKRINRALGYRYLKEHS